MLGCISRSGLATAVALVACGGPPAAQTQATSASHRTGLCARALDCEGLCDTGTSAACDAAGVYYELGEGVAQSYPRALKLYQRACEGNVATGCNHLGLFHEIGLAVPQDFGAAVSLFQRACDADLSDGCANLALKYLEGSGVPKDSDRARTLFQRACELGHTHACEQARAVARPVH